jgi:hypothetical protein
MFQFFPSFPTLFMTFLFDNVSHKTRREKRVFPDALFAGHVFPSDFLYILSGTREKQAMGEEKGKGSSKHTWIQEVCFADGVKTVSNIIKY